MPISEADHTRNLEELEQSLNDPAVPINPARIWILLSEIARYSARALAKEGSPTDPWLPRAGSRWPDPNPIGCAEAG
jgi:hypothetical protein